MCTEFGDFGFYCSTFGNDLEPTSNWLEVIFSICITLSGLMLFTLLIVNIQVKVSIHFTYRKNGKFYTSFRILEYLIRHF